MFAELWRRWFDGLVSQPWWCVVALAVATLVWKRDVWTAPRARIGAIAIIVAGVAWAWSLLWASDDAFITFRYAENFANGHGLVFNPGERVEGYTDFLWALLIAACIKLGLPPGESGVLLSLASFVAALVLVVRRARTLPGTATFPLGLALTAANYSVASFATGGLETVFAMMLVLLAVDLAHDGRAFSAGLAGVLAAMSHPDHVLFYGALGVALLWHTRSLKSALRYAAPFFIVFLPWFLWRWHYYGDLFPNTYYAKSGGEAWFSQGGKYLLVSLIGSGAALTLPLVVVGLVKTRATLFGRFALIALPGYLAYVAKIGGDFMLGRLLVSAFPLLFLLAEAGLRTLDGRAAPALGLVAALALTPVHIVKQHEIYEGIADERTFTPVTRFSPMEVDAHGFRLGQALHAQLTAKGLTPRVAIFSLGMTGYYSRLPTFDLRGLASRSVAHQPIFARTRPGHEKVATVGQVLEADVDLSMIALAPPPYAALMEVNVGGTPFWLRRSKPELVSALRGADVGAWVDAQRLDEERARVECTAWFLASHYFPVNADPTRRDRVLAKLQARDVELANDVALVLEPPASRGWTPRTVFDFERAWADNGWWVHDAPPRQQRPFGQRGGFVDTYTRDGDAATGVTTSPEFELKGDALTLLVGGGFAAGTRVELLVDGARVREVRGCDSEWLGERAWDTAAWRGKRAQLRVVDETPGGWGHVMVDELVEWSR